MKKILLIAFTGILLGACKNSRTEQKAVLDDILKTHEKVMGNEDALMRNKMKIDTLLNQNVPADVKATASGLSSKLVHADDDMSNWMQKFDPEFKGKNDDASLAYFKDQQKAIIKVDSQMNAAINESNKFLSQIKK